MEPLTLATAFATIVGLICNFKQERKDLREATKKEFLLWLDEHRHEETKEYIERNISLSQAIDNLLRQNHEELIECLDYIGNRITALSSSISGLGEIAHAINPDYELSEQGISILRQLVNSGSEAFLKLSHLDKRSAFLILLSGGNIECNEDRFINDDLKSLVELNLLNLRLNRKGDEVYGITRNAVVLIEMIDSKK